MKNSQFEISFEIKHDAATEFEYLGKCGISDEYHKFYVKRNVGEGVFDGIGGFVVLEWNEDENEWQALEDDVVLFTEELTAISNYITTQLI